MLGEHAHEAGIRRRLATLEQAQLGQDRGGGADRGHGPAGAHPLGDRGHEGIDGLEVGGAGDAAGQDEHVVVVQVRLGQGEVAGDDDVVGGDDGPLGGYGDHRRGDTGAEEDVHGRQRLDLLQSRRDEDGDRLVGLLVGGSVESGHVSSRKVISGACDWLYSPYAPATAHRNRTGPSAPS